MVDPTVLAALHAAAFQGVERCWSADEFAALQSDPSVVLALAGEAAGFAMARLAADEAELLTLAVSPSHRRQGVGRAALDAVSGAVRARGGLRFFLEVRADNVAALQLYRSSGFKPVGRRRAYYGAGIDALVMCRELVA